MSTTSIKLVEARLDFKQLNCAY